MLRIRNPGPPLSEREIDELERNFGHIVPNAYRDFLLAFNGGYTDGWVTFKIPHEDDWSDVDVFYRVTGGLECDRILFVLSLMDGRLPDGFLPIASDSGGDSICIQCNGPGTGRIYFWDHELETDPPSMENMTLLAENLDEFIASLRTEPDDSE